MNLLFMLMFTTGFHSPLAETPKAVAQTGVTLPPGESVVFVGLPPEPPFLLDMLIQAAPGRPDFALTAGPADLVCVAGQCKVTARGTFVSLLEFDLPLPLYSYSVYSLALHVGLLDGGLTASALVSGRIVEGDSINKPPEPGGSFSITAGAQHLFVSDLRLQDQTGLVIGSWGTVAAGVWPDTVGTRDGNLSGGATSHDALCVNESKRIFRDGFGLGDRSRWRQLP